jgi:hypothetical protein
VILNSKLPDVKSPIITDPYFGRILFRLVSIWTRFISFVSFFLTSDAFFLTLGILSQCFQALIREVFAAVQLTDEFKNLNLLRNSDNTVVNSGDLVFKGSAYVPTSCSLNVLLNVP